MYQIFFCVKHFLHLFRIFIHVNTQFPLSFVGLYHLHFMKESVALCYTDMLSLSSETLISRSWQEE